MLYLMGQIAVLLLLASMLGFTIGWLVRGINARGELEALNRRTQAQLRDLRSRAAQFGGAAPAGPVAPSAGNATDAGPAASSAGKATDAGAPAPASSVPATGGAAPGTGAEGAGRLGAATPPSEALREAARLQQQLRHQVGKLQSLVEQRDKEIAYLRRRLEEPRGDSGKEAPDAREADGVGDQSPSRRHTGGNH